MANLISARCSAGGLRGDIRSLLLGGGSRGSLRKPGLIKGAGTRSLSIMPCGLAGSIGGLFRSGRSTWGGTWGGVLALSSNLPNPGAPPVPPLDLGGRLPESSPLERGGKPAGSSFRNRVGGRLPVSSPPRDLGGGLLPVSVPLEPGRLIAESSLLVVVKEAATESWLMLLGPSLRNGAGWLPTRPESTLEAGDEAPLGGTRPREFGGGG